MKEGRHPDKLGASASRPAKPLDTMNRAPLPSSSSMAETSYKPEYHPPIPPPNVSTIPPPISMPPTATVPETVEPYQNMYRYGSETAAPPPPPPMYTHMTLVGGPAANLPTHGHNQIFVNNVRK